jgi:hypothetical protein
VRQPFAACARHGDDPRAAAHCLDGGVVAPIMRAVLLSIIRLDTCARMGSSLVSCPNRLGETDG